MNLMFSSVLWLSAGLVQDGPCMLSTKALEKCRSMGGCCSESTCAPCDKGHTQPTPATSWRYIKAPHRCDLYGAFFGACKRAGRCCVGTACVSCSKPTPSPTQLPPTPPPKIYTIASREYSSKSDLYKKNHKGEHRCKLDQKTKAKCTGVGLCCYGYRCQVCATSEDDIPTPAPKTHKVGYGFLDEYQSRLKRAAEQAQAEKLRHVVPVTLAPTPKPKMNKLLDFCLLSTAAHAACTEEGKCCVGTNCEKCQTGMETPAPTPHHELCHEWDKGMHPRQPCRSKRDCCYDGACVACKTAQILTSDDIKADEAKHKKFSQADAVQEAEEYMQKYSFGSKQRGPTSQPTPRPIIPCIMTASAFQKCYDSGKCCNGLSCEVCQNKHDAKKKSGDDDDDAIDSLLMKKEGQHMISNDGTHQVAQSYKGKQSKQKVFDDDDVAEAEHKRHAKKVDGDINRGGKAQQAAPTQKLEGCDMDPEEKRVCFESHGARSFCCERNCVRKCDEFYSEVTKSSVVSVDGHCSSRASLMDQKCVKLAK